MNSILEELHNGDVLPGEQITSYDSAFYVIGDKIEKQLDAWKEKLSPEDYEQLENLLDLCDESEHLISVETFAYGMKLGAMLTTELFPSERKLTRRRN